MCYNITSNGVDNLKVHPISAKVASYPLLEVLQRIYLLGSGVTFDCKNEMKEGDIFKLFKKISTILFIKKKK